MFSRYDFNQNYIFEKYLGLIHGRVRLVSRTEFRSQKGRKGLGVTIFFLRFDDERKKEREKRERQKEKEKEKERRRIRK